MRPIKNTINNPCIRQLFPVGKVFQLTPELGMVREYKVVGHHECENTTKCSDCPTEFWVVEVRNTATSWATSFCSSLARSLREGRLE